MSKDCKNCVSFVISFEFALEDIVSFLILTAYAATLLGYGTVANTAADCSSGDMSQYGFYRWANFW